MVDTKLLDTSQKRAKEVYDTRETAFRNMFEELYRIGFRDGSEYAHKTAKWVNIDIHNCFLSKCSNCGFVSNVNSFKYCPDCGSFMGEK